MPVKVTVEFIVDNAEIDQAVSVVRNVTSVNTSNYYSPTLRPPRVVRAELMPEPARHARARA